MTTRTDNSFSPGWGLRLQQARKAAGKTQEEMGQALGVRNTAVSKWEKEAIEAIDERSLTTLEYVLGIRRDWLILGEFPMLMATWDREIAKKLIQDKTHSSVDGIWPIPEHSGLAPDFVDGELVFWTKEETLSQGDWFVAAPLRVELTGAGLPPDSAVAGQAFSSRGGEDWLLYRPEDRIKQGAFPPVSMRGLRVIGRIIAVVSPIPKATPKP